MAGDSTTGQPTIATAETVIEDDRWQAAGLEHLAGRALRATMDHLALNGEAVVMGCDDARIAALNAEFRGKPQATNVLSWPAEEWEGQGAAGLAPRPAVNELGDIAIAYDTCAAEAAAQGKTLDDHATHLLVHAVLHLCGFDHMSDAEAETMEAAERSILATMGIADPYESETDEFRAAIQ